MGRKRGSAARAVRNNLKSLIKQSLIPDLLQRPPFGFDEVIMIGYVRIIHVRPETNGTGEILPHPLVFPYTFLALPDKGIKSVLFDLFLAVKSQFLLHFQFNGKSMGIPACFSGNHVAFHGTVSWDHILDHSGKHVSDMRLAVCRGRAVIEGIGRAFLSVFHTLFENVIIFPKFFNFFFAIHEIEIGVYFLVHCFRPFLFIFGDVQMIVYVNILQDCKKSPVRKKDEG